MMTSTTQPFALDLGSRTAIAPGEKATFEALIEVPFRPERLVLSLGTPVDRCLWAWFQTSTREVEGAGLPATAYVEGHPDLFRTLLPGMQVRLTLRNESPDPVVVIPRLVGVIADPLAAASVPLLGGWGFRFGV